MVCKQLLMPSKNIDCFLLGHFAFFPKTSLVFCEAWMEHLWWPTETYLLKLPQAAISKAASRLALYWAPLPCLASPGLCIWEGGGGGLMQKGRRDLRWETWIWGFDQRPFWVIVSHWQRPRPPICNLFTDCEQPELRPGHPRKTRKGESKWANCLGKSSYQPNPW